MHLRGLFYRIVAIGGVLRPDGTPFTNTDKNWVWLVSKASKAARWLGYVPFSRIRDERNAAPYLHLPPEPNGGYGSFEMGGRIEIPTLSWVLPRVGILPPRAQQPFRIVLIGEEVFPGRRVAADRRTDPR